MHDFGCIVTSFSFHISIPCNEADENDDSDELEELEKAGPEKEHEEPKPNAAPKPVAAPAPKEAALRSRKITMLSRSQNFVHKLENFSHTSGLMTAIQVINSLKAWFGNGSAT